MARKTTPRKRSRKARVVKDTTPWGLWVAVMILAVAGLRLGINAMGWVPVHFDEGQYWAYGHELAWGHFSKPPLVGWVILLATQLGGDTTFWLRIGVVLAHTLTAAFVYGVGARLFDGKIGFWAAAGFTAAPGVTVSAMIMTTDPVMMAGWALGLYAWVRAAEGGGKAWWVVMGAAIGAAMLAKYTALAFAGAALGYGLLSARERNWTGTAIALGAGALVFAPNIWWQMANSFHTVTHVAEDAAPPGDRYNLGKLAEFLGAQLGVIGPVWFLAMLAALWKRNDWLDDWRMRLLAWQTFPLLIAITVLAFYTRAQPNWAAPAYVAGSVLAARWLLMNKWTRALQVQAAVGMVGALALYGAAWAWANHSETLPRGPDPFKKMRLAEPFCGPVLAAMDEHAVEVLLSNDRRRLSECMFLGGFGFEGIAVWNPDGIPDNHHELVSNLNVGDERLMLLATMSDASARDVAAKFETATEVETGTFQTHAGREYGYAIWVVQGFRGY
ncbi:MAG: ArnT family glycosyltransferase [Paracoccaceae bacterium]